jgi:hypothetical protein
MSNNKQNKFGNIPQKIWERLEGNEKQFLFKYNYYMEKIEKINDEIDDYMIIIDNLRKERKKCEKRSTKIWNENKHLNENYSLTYNISTNKKYTTISKRKGFNSEGKSQTELLKDRKLIGKYWLVNFKYKGKSKSIHIGEDKSVIKFLKENNDLKGSIVTTNNLTEDEIRKFLSYLIEDNLYELVYGDIIGEYNLNDKKIKLEDLL